MPISNRLPQNMSLLCYVETRQNQGWTLAYSSHSIREFLKNAPGEFSKLVHHVPNSSPLATIIITVSGIDKRVDFCGERNGKFYSHKSGGNFKGRALGVKTIQKLLERAVDRPVSYQEEEKIRQANMASVTVGGI